MMLAASRASQTSPTWKKPIVLVAIVLLLVVGVSLVLKTNEDESSFSLASGLSALFNQKPDDTNTPISVAAATQATTGTTIVESINAHDLMVPTIQPRKDVANWRDFNLEDGYPPIPVTSPEVQSLSVLEKQSVYNILLLGDSLTKGLVRSSAHSILFHPYGTQLAKLLHTRFPHTKFNVDIHGVSGECVTVVCAGNKIPDMFDDAVSTALEKDVKYDIVIILGGTNDIGGNRATSTEILNALIRLHRHAIALNVDVPGAKALRTLALAIPQADSQDSAFLQYGEEERKFINAGLRHMCEVDSLKFNSELFGHKRPCLFVDLYHAMTILNFETDPKERMKRWSDNLHPTKEGYDFMASIIFQYLLHLLPANLN